MSLAELLTVIRALPKAEQVQLLHLLVDGVSGDASSDEESAFLSSVFPQGGAFEIATPPDCYEAAAALQSLLDAEEGRE